jgi:hypothetical protein
VNKEIVENKNMLVKKLFSLLPLFVVISAQGWGQQSQVAQPLTTTVAETTVAETTVAETTVAETTVAEAPVANTIAEQVAWSGNLGQLPSQVQDAPTTAAQAPVIGGAALTETTVNLLNFEIALKPGGSGLLEDLGLSTYLYDTLKPVFPGLSSIQLQLNGYQPGSYTVPYKGVAEFVEFTAIVDEYDKLMKIEKPTLFATGSIVQPAVIQTTSVTAEMLQNAQIAALSDIASIDGFWAANAATVGTNLQVEGIIIVAGLTSDSDGRDFTREPWVIAIAAASAVIVLFLMVWFMPHRAK